MAKSVIEEIVAVGDSGAYKATLSFGKHVSAIEVIGFSIDECISRAEIIRDAIRLNAGVE